MATATESSSVQEETNRVSSSNRLIFSSFNTELAKSVSLPISKPSRKKMGRLWVGTPLPSTMETELFLNVTDMSPGEHLSEGKTTSLKRRLGNSGAQTAPTSHLLTVDEAMEDEDWCSSMAMFYSDNDWGLTHGYWDGKESMPLGERKRRESYVSFKENFDEEQRIRKLKRLAEKPMHGVPKNDTSYRVLRSCSRHKRV